MRHAIKVDVFTLAKPTHTCIHTLSLLLIIILNKTSKNIQDSRMSAIDMKYGMLCLHNNNALSKVALRSDIYLFQQK